MIDSHCHLNFDTLKKNIKEIILNAQNNHITSILSINTDPKEFISHYELIQNYKSIFISYGLHPEHVTNTNIIATDDIVKHSTKPKVIGIGETGLDFYHSIEFKKDQYKSFENHIEASIKTNLPLIIHQRNSEKEIIDVLKKFQKQNNLKVVFHCFTGSNELKNFCLDNNYLMSLSGIVTFKNALNLREVIKDIPISSLLIETDSPFLAPVPFRGKINEPSFVKYIGVYLSEFYNISQEKFIMNLNNNFYNLFSKAIRYETLI